jgi:hypothetical protein
LADSAEPEEQKLVAGDLESGKALQLLERALQTTGIHLRGPAAALALKVVVMVAGVASDEAHDLIASQDAFGPALLDKALQVPIDGG